jgi:hypothetical protein
MHSNRSQTCGFREPVTIFERFLLLKIVRFPSFRSIGFRGISWQTAPQRYTSASPRTAETRSASLFTSSRVASSLNTRWSLAKQPPELLKESRPRKPCLSGDANRTYFNKGNNGVIFLSAHGISRLLNKGE